jgi:predicted NBD/HSP70 family sugar kinase
MIALGVDIGGTKIEVQTFGPDWSVISRRRIGTPRDYPAFLAAITEQVRWGMGDRATPVPLGISTAGYANPATGAFLAANLPASGKLFLADITSALGQDVVLVNDACAFTQSEAVFGAAKHERIVVGVILGTGVGGGIVIDGQLHRGAYAAAGEFGHTAASANTVMEWDLPLVRCRCGRLGCIETLASGPGLKRICQSITARNLEPEEIAAMRADSGDVARVWQAWCALVAELLLGISLCIEPDVFVLGGGLSKTPGIADDISEALEMAHFIRGGCPAIRLAEGGDASGARGAAYAAWRANERAIR